MEQLKVKDRILENISLSVKKLQSYFAACEDETPAIRNHDKVLQRLCEHLDHALLYGLQDISSGYWVVVVHFTRKEAIKQIEVLEHIATNMGRSRAWLYLALSENSLESYLRLFQENQSLLHKYYYENSLVCSHDHLTLFLTLVSGLEFIRFDLDLDVPYLDLAPYMPDYYKPQHLLDFEDRLPSSMHGSDSLSLNSFNSVTSTNLEWDDSAIAPSSEDYDFGDVFPAVQSMPSTDWEDGDLTDTTSCPRSATYEVQALNGHKASSRSPTLRYNPFNYEKSEMVSSAETTPVHSAFPQKDEALDDASSYTDSYPELEVIRLAKKKKTSKKKRSKPEEGLNNVNSSVEGKPLEDPEASVEQRVESPAAQEERTGLQDAGDMVDEDGNGQNKTGGETRLAEGGQHADSTQMGLLIPEMKDTSMESVGQPLSEVIDQLNGALDPAGWKLNREHPDQSFRISPSGETPDGTLYRDFGEGFPAPMDFYRFTPESPSASAAGGGDNDPSGTGQSAHVPGGSEAAVQAAESKAKTPGAVGDIPVVQCNGSIEAETPVAETGGDLLGSQTAVSTPNAKDSGIEEGPNSPSEMIHPADFRVDNNLLLLLMIHVFRENEEQLYKMIRMSTGHMEGNMQLLYVLLTDCYIYLLRKGAADKPYTVEDAVSYNELDYISVGVDHQTVMLVCTNRRRQFLLDTADKTLTEFFVAVVKSAMIKGCREPPYPSVLTDATMEKLALSKFVAQESKCEASDVTIHLYGLIHWEDPMDVTMGPQSGIYRPAESAVTKEGVLYYKAGTSYLGKEHWKPCFVVLSTGFLYQYPDQIDITPLLSINMASEQCGGCRRSNTTERPHSFQVILTDRPALELSAENEEEMADWMLYLCQAVSKGVIPQGVVSTPCIPCCLVVTPRQMFTCHEDCQTSFFRSLGSAELANVTGVAAEAGKEYCIVEFTEDHTQLLPPWVLYFSCTSELDRFLTVLATLWRNINQVELPRKPIQDPISQKKCEDALSLIHNAWQRSDSLHRGRSERDPWC
ncbi:pleckstrin homology domain-containing family M member 2 [Latimeria chalumnae]|uniref:pleckstrin homology domain-containing family M member 2 n=1 Tax=Latimeria chalumnae TaxID=7897 RepID=UPI00313D1690